LAAVLLGAAPRPAPLTVYSAPAATRLAGASTERPVDAVLPDGRIAAPLGEATFVGTDPLGLALSPDGRYAVVVNAQQSAAQIAPPAPAPNVVAGYSIAVVDARTLKVAYVYRDPDMSLFTGVAVTHDPANPARTLVLVSDGAHNLVRSFDLGSDGTLTPDGASIPVAGFPDAITLGGDEHIAYVASNIGNRITAIDLTARRVIGTAPTGFFPAGIAAINQRLYVTNGGLAAYAALPQPVAAPSFAAPDANATQSSSLSVFNLDASGNVDSTGAQMPTVPMDPVPDGVQSVGGARPDAIAVRRRGLYAYVALANVDRVATVQLGADPHVVAGLDLRLFPNAPYGTQPSAEVLSRDDKRLYVALAGLNAVAVLDARNPAQLHRLGLIPTASYPSALALSPDGRYLYVTAAKGVGGWGELQRVDLRKLPLEAATLSALRYNRSVAAAGSNPVVPPLRSGKRSSVIDRVVYIAIGDENYDAIFGDLGKGNGDAAYVVDGASTTPNLHALASAYGIADNFYADALNLDANAQAALAGAATLYTQRVVNVAGGRTPLDDRGNDPEDYARDGYLFNALSRADLTFRDYGGLLALSGYRVTGTRTRMPSYTLDVPALAVLNGHVDLNYPGPNPAIADAARASEFVADMGALVNNDQEPAFTYIDLPADAPGGIAAADRALGQIVAFLSRTPHWSSTAVFVVARGVAAPRDHVDGSRSYALVVSPLAKPGYVGHVHTSVASVVKTEEELFGLPPLSLGDLLSSDMADFFGQVPYPTSYQALP
jgi:DNA-binding beta-propeller fold protein YncE